MKGHLHLFLLFTQSNSYERNESDYLEYEKREHKRPCGCDCSRQKLIADLLCLFRRKKNCFQHRNFKNFRLFFPPWFLHDRLAIHPWSDYRLPWLPPSSQQTLPSKRSQALNFTLNKKNEAAKNFRSDNDNLQIHRHRALFFLQIARIK
jgi:hypothetical protein